MDKRLIIREIKNYLNIEKDKDFAKYLGIKTTTLSMWYKRNSYDIELLFKKCEFVNAEWLLTGRGNMLKQDVNLECVEKQNVQKKRPSQRVAKRVAESGGNETCKKSDPLPESASNPPDNTSNEIIQLLKENKQLVEEKNTMLEKEVSRLSKEVSNLSTQNKALAAENANLQAKNKELNRQLNISQAECNTLKKQAQKKVVV